MSITLANAIKAARLRKGKKQWEIADALGVSRSAVGQWEAGSNDPSTQNLIKLGNLLDVDFTSASERVVTEVKRERINGIGGVRTSVSAEDGFDVPVTHLVATPEGAVLQVPSGDHIAHVRRFDFFDEMPNIYAMVFASNVLSPRYGYNDVVYVNPDEMPTSGEYAVLTLSSKIVPNRSSAQIVRRVLLIDDNRLITERLNPSHQEDWLMPTLERVDRIIPEYELVRRRGKQHLPK